MAEYETITQNGHTYKRRKGSRDRWVDEEGNVVDLSKGKRTVTQSSSSRLGSGSNSANPDVWIKDGKAYKDGSHGGYKTNYFNAVKKLGQNLGWDVKAGSKSEKALKNQNAALNAGRIKTVKGNTAHIGENGKAVGIKPKLQKKPQTQPESGWDRAAASWNSGWSKVGQGFKDIWQGANNTRPDGVHTGNEFSDRVENFVGNQLRQLGGAGRVLMGLGEATVGATLNGLWGDTEAMKALGKYGQVADLGKLSNSTAELFHGNLMAPWDEKNNGLLSDNFTWLGNKAARQDIQDAANGVAAILGTKGAVAGLKSAISGVKSGVRTAANTATALRNGTTTIGEVGRQVAKATGRQAINSGRALQRAVVNEVMAPVRAVRSGVRAVHNGVSTVRNGIRKLTKKDLPANPSTELAVIESGAPRVYYMGPKGPGPINNRSRLLEGPPIEDAIYTEIKPTSPGTRYYAIDEAPFERPVYNFEGHDPYTGYADDFKVGATNEFGEVWGPTGDFHKKFTYGNRSIGGEPKYGWNSPEAQVIGVEDAVPIAGPRVPRQPAAYEPRGTFIEPEPAPVNYGRPSYSTRLTNKNKPHASSEPDSYFNDWMRQLEEQLLNDQMRWQEEQLLNDQLDAYQLVDDYNNYLDTYKQGGVLDKKYFI